MRMKLVVASAMSLACAAGASFAAYAVDPMQPSAVGEVIESKSSHDFFETAASADMFEIQASKLAQTKSSDPAVKAFADKMITDHTESSTKLAALAATKNVTLPTTMLKRHQHMLNSLIKDPDGAKFDKDYKSKMVMTHKEAVTLFSKDSKKSDDPDIRAFATQLLPTLQQHGGMAHDLSKPS